MRSLAIAVFYSAGTGIGGVAAPWFFARLIDSGSREAFFAGYVVAAALMAIAATIELLIGVDAERKQLEQIAALLSAAE